MTKIWDSYTRIGTAHLSSNAEIRRVIICNIMVLINVSTSAFFCLIYLFLEKKPDLALYLFIAGLISILPLVATALKRTYLARVILVTIVNVSLFVIGWLDAPGPVYPYFFALIIPFVLFSTTRPITLFSFILMTSLCWFFYDFYIDTDSPRDVFHFIVIYATYALIVFTLYQSFKVANKDAEKVESSIADLNVANNELKKVQAQLIEHNEQMIDTTEALTLAQGALIDNQKKLEVARQKAEASSDAKSTFLTNISHEIRTPLNAIIGFTDLLLSEKVNPKKKEENLKSILFSAKHLSKIIHDILDIARIESGKLRITKKKFDILALFKEVQQSHELVHKEKNIEFKLAIDSLMPQFLFGDETKLNQILLNLYGNAVKFTPEGNVTLESKVTDRDDKRVLVRFSVKDTGTGIPEEKQEIIFESFSQLESAAMSKGTGLGLAITKNLVKLLGGTLKLKSEVGTGSEFYFTLPFELKIDKEKPESAVVKNTDKIKGKEVLLVEDNEMNQLLIAQFLDHIDLKYQIVGSAEEALNLIQLHDFDLVITDVHLPGMGGKEFISRLHEMSSPLPTIVTTADASKFLKNELKKKGVRHFIPKPIIKDDLYNSIFKCLT